MHAENLRKSINFWITALDQYSFTQLCTKPSANGWSAGQLYLHLINDTNFYFDQVNICLSNNHHAQEEASGNAKKMFLQNSFPNEIIEGDPSNQYIPQPENKEQLVNALADLKKRLAALELPINSGKSAGKTKHPGLHYFSAAEWLQFADMHFRHHLQQKKRIDDYLYASNIN